MYGLCINLDVVLAFKILDQNFEQKFIRFFSWPYSESSARSGENKAINFLIPFFLKHRL